MCCKQLAGLVFLLIMSQSIQAQIYKCENEAGEINFSDEPCSKGETGQRLNWLKGTTSAKKKKQINKRSPDYVSARAKKIAKKAKRNNEAYVLLSLLTTTQLELNTASLRSSLAGKITDAPELLLPDGITVDLLKVDKILFTYRSGKNEVQARFIMDDGYEEVKWIKKPFPVISGEAKIGRFSKSLGDIKRIEFFNSKKLLKKSGKESSVGKQPSAKKQPSAGKASSKNTTISNKSVPVIDLDLSHQMTSKVPQRELIGINQLKKPKIKVVNNKSGSGIQVDFVNNKKITLQRGSLSSSKGSQQSRGQHFVISDKTQIPYADIKMIKVRPTAKNQLIVAIELKTKEIKMEVMSPPFTRIIGQSSAGSFEHSLLEIKSISFQR